MKLLITGAAGQLGNELLRQLKEGGSALGPIPERLKHAKVVAVDLPDADLANLAEAKGLIGRHAPDAVIHCAAFTNVDRCETEPDTAFAANAVAARNVAMACEAVNARMVHISTDYVLSGEGSAPAPESTLPAPQSVYGASKLLGESYVRDFCSRWFILRTAWLYGRVGNNFVKTILKLARDKGELTVVNDQLGNPTNAEDLAHHILQLAPTEEYGLYHTTCNGVCSWFDFASEIVRLSGLAATVTPCTTAEFVRAAKRPAYSALDNAMLRATVGDGMRTWQQALEAYFAAYSTEELLA